MFLARGTGVSGAGNGFDASFQPRDALDRLLPGLSGLSSPEARELRSLEKEGDTEIFWPDLLRFASKLASRDKLETAKSIFSFVLNAAPEKFQSQAKIKLDAIEGRGQIGARVEFLLGHFTQDAFSPNMIFPMMAGSAVYGLAKGIGMGRLALAAPIWWTRGSAGKLTASMMGYAAEVSTFTLASRLMHEKNNLSFGQELLSSAITLGLLKSSGSLTQSYLKNLTSRPSPLLQSIVGQSALFLGLATAHRAEEALGLRPQMSDGTAMTDILSSMVNLGVGASLGHRVLGKAYGTRIGELTIRLDQGPRSPSTPEWIPNGSRLALALGPSTLRSNQPLEDETNIKRPQLTVESSGPTPIKRVVKGIDLSAQIKSFEEQRQRIYRKLETVFPEIEADQAQKYLDEFDQIGQRQDFWRKQQELLKDLQGEDALRFGHDIEIGLKLLNERLLRLGAEIFQEPLATDQKPRWGLKFKAPPEPKTETGNEILSGRVQALVNRDAGYGESLSLRDHQIAALHAIRGRIKLLQATLAEGKDPALSALAGTVVMPVGGGKTRTMVAAFAAGLELGWVKPQDKLVILNHTTQIHEQNLKVTELLGPYFKQLRGRNLKISEYKADTKDLSGDVVVVSIPTIQGEAGRALFREQLRAELGEAGQVAMVAVDEVHHLGLSKGKTQETWAESIHSLRQVSPGFLELGFTATPTGKEPGRIFSLRERELMQARVTPRTYLVKIEGIDLSQLKVAASGEFEQRSLQSTLLGHPERNQRIFNSLTRHGLRQTDLSPGGHARLEGTIAFTQDLKHAQAMAQDYARYYQQGSGNLFGRKLLILGENKGQIRPKELEHALEIYRKGEIDGIVALVSGLTKGQKDPILAAVERGEIEAVFTVDALVEGADLHMFSHQIGGRPTFSRFKKGQERGRVNRRSPDEVSSDGRLLKDPPRILFDVVDRYLGERPLARYGDIMGIAGHTQLQSGQMLDALSGQVVAEIGHPEIFQGFSPSQSKQRGKTPASEFKSGDWTPLMQRLVEILESQYGGKVEAMSWDLGTTEFFVEGLLQGEGWENNRWFLKRLGTLLYQDRQDFMQIYRQPLIRAFQGALTQIENQMKLVNYRNVADLAHQIYIQDHPEAEPPSPISFWNYVSSKAIPEIITLLEASPWVEKSRQIPVAKIKAVSAFREALGQLETEKRKSSPKAIADLAHQIYIQNLPEAEQPKSVTFENFVAGSKAVPEIKALLDASLYVERNITVDKVKALATFQEALEQLQARGVKSTRYKVADLAHQIYIQDLPEAEQPSQGTFQWFVKGADANPKIMALVEASPWVEKNRHISVDKSKAVAAFQKVLFQLETKEKKSSPRAIADLAHQIYIQDLPEAGRPSQGTFQQFVTGSKASPEIMTLLEASHRVEKNRQIDVDKIKAAAAFREILGQLETEKRKSSPHAIADLAYQIYIRDLPATERPSQGAFRKSVRVSLANLEINALLNASPWVERRQVNHIDKIKAVTAFSEALKQLVREEKKMSPHAVAELAHKIYIQDLAETERPSLSTFRQIIGGSRAIPEIINLLKASPWIERHRP